MTSPTFQHVLRETGYLRSSGQPASGLTVADRQSTPRLRAVFDNDHVGLYADAVFSAQNVPTTIFKDAAEEPPSDAEVRRWHEAAWNLSTAPLLWIVTPTDVRLYDCYASPSQRGPHSATVRPLESFVIGSEDQLRALDAACGRLATETGAFWSSPIGAAINRRHRVDRELLAEIAALEQSLIDLTPTDVSPQAVKQARDLAQRLIGRCIFAWYLLDRGLAQPFLPTELPPDLSAIFRTRDSAFALFDWLHETFNGDLFPIEDRAAEHHYLTDKRLSYLRDFVEGTSLIPERQRQGRLFRFRFGAIPVDLISSIYEQFARAREPEETKSQGLHYTPVELVHLTLDPLFEELPHTARVVDPTCGSGAFLVEAFRRLVWRKTGGRPATRALVRQILYRQLFGVDINLSALRIAAFSLYLAALELDNDPIDSIDALRFDHLIGTSLFEHDSLASPLPAPLTAREFDAVVGNPPWTFTHRHGQPYLSNRRTPRPRRSPDQDFLRVGAKLAGNYGRIAMIMKATPFFSKDRRAIESRNDLLRTLAPVALINLSYLRREKLFPDATGPALLFFSRCSLTPDSARLLVGSCPWSPSFKRTGVFQIGPGEVRSVPLARVLHLPPLLKAATFGTVRDSWLLTRLETEFPTLDDVLTSLGILRLTHRGQGYQVKGDTNPSPDHYFDLPVVTTENFAPLRIDPARLSRFDFKTLHRVRNPSIFHGPLVLCANAATKDAIQTGRYSASVIDHDTLYNESYFGISFAASEPRFAYLLAGILNSSITAFQLALGGPTWGLERPTVKPHDLLSLRVPCFARTDAALVNAVVEAENKAAEAPSDSECRATLDQAVFDFYDLEHEERILVADSVVLARHLITENNKERSRLITHPDADILRGYARQVAQTINVYLRARDTRHIEATIYDSLIAKADNAGAIPGVTPVRFVMASGGPSQEPVVRTGNQADITALASMIRGRFDSDIPPYLNEQRQLRIYGDQDLFILKPAEARYWTHTAALNDADIILADHWLSTRDAAAHA